MKHLQKAKKLTLLIFNFVAASWTMSLVKPFSHSSVGWYVVSFKQFLQSKKSLTNCKSSEGSSTGKAKCKVNYIV